MLKMYPTVAAFALVAAVGAPADAHHAIDVVFKSMRERLGIEVK
jgi:uncharacterized protein (DUF2267 family)